MKPTTSRICIYPKDVQRIMGKTYKQARLYLNKVKKERNKEPHHLLSIQEFCEHTGLQIDHVIGSLAG